MNFSLFQFLVAEHGSVQKEKVTEDYNDAYPLKISLHNKLIFMCMLKHRASL